MDRRRKYVMTLIEMGWSDKYDLLQIVKKNTNWQVTDRQIYTYIAGCFKILQNRAQQDADRIFGCIRILWGRSRNGGRRQRQRLKSRRNRSRSPEQNKSHTGKLKR